jgi:ribosomal protein S18 acetylase RimI-like enzyme
MPDAIVRPLAPADLGAIDRICVTSAWTTTHFSPADLPRLLTTRPGIGVFHPQRPEMQAFLLATVVNPPVAWLGGFGVEWSQRHQAMHLLDLALPPWLDLLRRRDARAVYYSGSDIMTDWLREPLLARGFRQIALLRSYDKLGTASPTTGNQQVQVRHFDPATDLAGVLAVENAAFAPLWRHDAAMFQEVFEDYPFFVVAVTPGGRIAGYQFSGIDRETGYLVRIAVHPELEGQGIGARLMAAAMEFFAARHVARILLNTEETNTHAHRLYEWFGFEVVEPRGFVLQLDL